MTAFRSALILILFAALVAFPEQHAVPSAGAQRSAAKPDDPLVAYFVTWHGTARGFGHETFYDREVAARYFEEMTGSAIVRFEDHGPGPLLPYDTRYLSLVDVGTYEGRVTHNPGWNGCCDDYVFSEVTNPSEYSGMYVRAGDPDTRQLVSAPKKRADGPTVMESPVNALGRLLYTHHVISIWTTSEGVSRRQEGTNREIALRLLAIDPTLELQASLPKNDSPLAMKVRDSSDAWSPETTQPPHGAYPVRVEWTAEARRLGKCAGSQSPISEGDPVIQNEDVAISPEKSEITPDTNTKVQVRVTCEQVPIKGAEVEIEVQPQDRSGGHNHSAKRPRGKLNDTQLTDGKPSITVKTDANGKATVRFDPPGDKTIQGDAGSRTGGIAGIYIVIAKAKRFPDRSDKVDVWVRFSDLWPLPESADYDICGRSTLGCKPAEGKNRAEGGRGKRGTDAHPDGMYGTTATLKAFQELAVDFSQHQDRHNRELQKCNKPAWKTRRVSVNDIALYWGGRFDHDTPKHAWRPPHQTHGRGQGGDVNHFHEEGRVQECDGRSVRLDDALTHTLLQLGEPMYGCWDEWDLSEPDHNLHLHVEDRTCFPE